MLFYSTTIEKVQNFMDVDNISPGDYANFMVEEMESLIVKCGKFLPDRVYIPGKVIKEYRMHVLKNF